MHNEFLLIAAMQAFQAWTATAPAEVIDRDTAFIVWTPALSGWIGDEDGILVEFDTPQEALRWLLGVHDG